ncbi:MAG: UDP-2,4-diacetamido-2,4,6-trideoxy-beta-L-altropyranose hydrolase [Pseudomonadota bacterium]
MPLRFVFRVDSSPLIGAGHVMRCLTLANMLRARGMECVFVCRDFPGNISAKIVSAAFEVQLLKHDPALPENNWLGAGQAEDADETLSAMKTQKPDWFVVDHYGIASEWEEAACAKMQGCKVLAIDDLADRKHTCDMLMDLSPGRLATDYDGLVSEKTKLLTGLDYALLRPGFAKLRQKLGASKSGPQKPANILVTFGGGNIDEPLRETLKAFAGMGDLVDLNLTVIGKKPEHELPDLLTKNVEWIEYEPDMASRMADADLMICAAGGTSWERCCLGVPAVALMVAENQRLNFEALEKSGAALCVKTDASEIASALKNLVQDQELYSRISANAWNLCDGEGAKRVADALLAQSMKVAGAGLEDARFIYDARYADGAERFYKNPVKPEYQDHVRWFESALQSDAYRFLSVTLKDEKFAHVRLDVDPQSPDIAELGIALAESYRGKGLAVPALLAAVKHAGAAGFKTINAEVHPENAASKRLFEAAGFALVGNAEDGLLHYQRTI